MANSFDVYVDMLNKVNEFRTAHGSPTLASDTNAFGSAAKAAQEYARGSAAGDEMFERFLPEKAMLKSRHYRQNVSGTDTEYSSVLPKTELYKLYPRQTTDTSQTTNYYDVNWRYDKATIHHKLYKNQYVVTGFQMTRRNLITGQKLQDDIVGFKGPFVDEIEFMKCIAGVKVKYANELRSIEFLYDDDTSPTYTSYLTTAAKKEPTEGELVAERTIKFGKDRCLGGIYGELSSTAQYLGTIGFFYGDMLGDGNGSSLYVRPKELTSQELNGCSQAIYYNIDKIKTNDISAAIAWNDQGKYYDFNIPGEYAVTRNYTQTIWKGATGVGFWSQDNWMIAHFCPAANTAAFPTNTLAPAGWDFKKDYVQFTEYDSIEDFAVKPPCYQQRECTTGYMDITDGNFVLNNAVTLTDCPGGQFMTTDAGGCACVPNVSCSTRTQLLDITTAENKKRIADGLRTSYEMTECGLNKEGTVGCDGAFPCCATVTFGIGPRESAQMCHSEADRISGLFKSGKKGAEYGKLGECQKTAAAIALEALQEKERKDKAAADAKELKANEKKATLELYGWAEDGFQDFLSIPLFPVALIMCAIADFYTFYNPPLDNYQTCLSVFGYAFWQQYF